MSKKKTPPKEDPKEDPKENAAVHTVPLEGLYKEWFLDYASYVILERAVPR